MNILKRWRSRDRTAAGVVAPPENETYVVVDENCFPFDCYETLDDARETVRYWSDRGVTMHIMRGSCT